MTDGSRLKCADVAFQNGSCMPSSVNSPMLGLRGRLEKSKLYVWVDDSLELERS